MIPMMAIPGRRFQGVWEQVGNDLSLGPVNSPIIAGMTAARVAYIDATNAQLRAYDWDGTDWTLTGSGLNLTSGGFGIAALTASTVAVYSRGAGTLSTYSFNGSTWSLVGSSLSRAESGIFCAICALTSTRIAYSDSNIVGPKGIIEVYDFNGSTWSKTGNTFDVTGTDALASSMSRLTDTTFAYNDASNDSLREYSFDGTNISLIGSSLSLVINDAAGMCLLSPGVIVLANPQADTLRTYVRSGSTWQQGEDTALSISGMSGSSIATLTNKTIAYIDSGNDDLRTYRLK